MMRNQNQFDETFHKHGIIGYKTLHLIRSHDSEGFVSLNNLISSNKDDEIWLDLDWYKDNGHLNNIGNKIKADKSGVNLMKEFINLVSPHSKIIKADFNKA